MEQQIIPVYRGIDNTVNEATVKNFALARCKNITLKNGRPECIISPSEITLTGSPSGRCNGEFECNLNGTTYHLVCYGTTLYKYSSGTLTSLYTSFNATKDLYFNVFNEKCIICQQGSSVVEFDGTTATAVTFTDNSPAIWGTTKPTASFTFNGRIYYWGDTNGKTKIYTPRTGTYNNFDNSTTDDVDVLTVHGSGNITGAISFTNDICIIFCENSIKRLSGSQPFSDTAANPHTIKTIIDGIGCISTRSIVKAGNDLYFLSQRGLESLIAVQQYGDVKINALFEKIKDDVSEFLFESELNSSSFAVYDHINSKIFLHLKTSSNETIRYGYDLTTGDIERAEFTNNFTSAAIIGGYISYGEAGKLYQVKNLYYTGEHYLETHWFYTKYGLNRLKSWDKVILEVETDASLENLIIETMHIKRSFEEGQWKNKVFSSNLKYGSLFDVGIFDVSYFDFPSKTVITLRDLGKSNALKLKISDSTTGEHFRILRTEYFYSPLGLTNG